MDKSGAASEASIDTHQFVTLDNMDRMDRDNCIYSETLFAHGDEVLIQHQGAHYRLRRTRNGKLILTK